MQTIHKEIRIDLIDEPLLKPRFGLEGPDLQELADSIAELGLIQPITVIPVGDRYRLIAGNRRLHACRDKLGWDTIPAIILDGFALEAEATIVENLQRVNLDPVEEAVMFAQLLKDSGKTQDEIAKQVGKSRSYIAKRLLLLDLDEETLGAIVRKDISWTHGLELRRLTDLNQRQYFLNLAVQHGVNVRVLRSWVDEALQQAQMTQGNNDTDQPPVNLQPIEYEPLRCLLCGQSEKETILQFVPICQADKMELERLLNGQK